MLCCSLSYSAAVVVVVVVYMFSQSVAKPADWKYQSGLCSSWATVSCSLNVDMLLPLPNNRTSTGNMEECLKVGTHTCAWDLFFFFMGTVLTWFSVSGRTESVGTPDWERTVSDWWKKATRGLGAHSGTGCLWYLNEWINAWLLV